MKQFINENKRFKRVQTPSVLQMEATECGAAALSMILRHYGKYLTLEQIRQDTGVGRDGSKASNLAQAAKGYDLETQSFQVDDLDDLAHIMPPSLLHWEFNHFVVFEGMDKQWCYINDPAQGPRRLSFREFGDKWTGIVMCFYPTECFTKVNQERPSWLKQTLASFKSVYLYLMLVSLFLVLPGLIIPGFSKVFVDEILIKSTHHWLPALLLGLGLTALCRALLSYLQKITLLRFTLNFVIEHSFQLVWRLLHTPLLFFFQRSIGDVCFRNQAYFRIGSLMTSQLSAALFNGFLALFYGIVIFLVSKLIGLMVLAAFMVMGVVFLITRRKTRETSFQSLQLAGGLAGVEVYGVQNVEMIKAQNDETRFFEQWTSRHAELVDNQQRLMLVTQLSSLIVNLMTWTVNASILIVGAWLIMQGELTAGLLVAVQSLVQSMFGPMTTLFSFGQSLETIQGDIRRVEDISYYETKKQGTHPWDSQQPGLLIGYDLSFRYSPFEPPAVSKVDVKIEEGKVHALIGPSGSGKSTLAKLLIGLLRPQEGQVEYHQRSLSDYDVEHLKEHVGYVDQDVMLFEGSLRDNLCLWNPHSSDDALMTVLEDVQLTQLLNQKGGLDFLIQEGGTNLSQGQKQRVEIARALLYQPKLMILDEATAALDAWTEAQIIDRLKSKNIGLLIITHRLQAVQNSDTLYVLEGGELVDQGTHTELLARSEVYQRLYSNEQ